MTGQALALLLALVAAVPANSLPPAGRATREASGVGVTPAATSEPPPRSAVPSRPPRKGEGKASAALPVITPWRANLTENEPPFEIQRLDPDTFVIRQSLATSPAAPFLYLLIGTHRALLLDTGTGNAALRPVIDAIMAQHGTPDLPLLIAHSHAHADHIGGDAEFAARPNTQIIGHTPAAVAAAFAIRDWPSGEGRIDLGNRRLTILATPGHSATDIMVHDPRTRLLLTGDSLTPGRITVPINAFAPWRASLNRAATYARRHAPRALLGAHIDLRRTPGEAYRQDARRHPEEHSLALAPASLFELQAAAKAMTGEPMRETHVDFIIEPRWPG